MTTIKTVLTFFVSGLLFGGVFGWLLSIHRLTMFWFRKGDKFLIPTYRYFVGMGLTLLAGFAFAFLISSRRHWLDTSRNYSILRMSFAVLAVAGSAVAPFGLVFLLPDPDPIAGYLVGVSVFILLVSSACWIVTSKLSYMGLLLNFLTVPVGLALWYCVVALFRMQGQATDFLMFPVFFCLLSTACGYWVGRMANPRNPKFT